MRLWHQDIISLLPRQQLLGQHRECCAMRGLGWGKKHATINYVFTHNPQMLYNYHLLIMTEMENRGYKADPLWLSSSYRGKLCNESYPSISLQHPVHNRYPEHNDSYLQECIDNLAGKGITIYKLHD